MTRGRERRILTTVAGTEVVTAARDTTGEDGKLSSFFTCTAADCCCQWRDTFDRFGENWDGFLEQAKTHGWTFSQFRSNNSTPDVRLCPHHAMLESLAKQPIVEPVQVLIQDMKAQIEAQAGILFYRNLASALAHERQVIVDMVQRIELMRHANGEMGCRYYEQLISDLKERQPKS